MEDQAGDFLKQLAANLELVLLIPLRQWFPTGGSRTPGGPKQDFQGSEMRFFRVRVCMSLHEHFFKRTDIYENLQVLLLKKYTLSSLIIPKYY